MAKISILDLTIHTWAPNTEGQPFVAFIGAPGQLPIVFKGRTSMQAHMKAEDWRKEEVEKIEAREAAKEKRLSAARNARAARKAEEVA